MRNETKRPGGHYSRPEVDTMSSNRILENLGPVTATSHQAGDPACPGLDPTACYD